jgi:hypothetical protein
MRIISVEHRYFNADAVTYLLPVIEDEPRKPGAKVFFSDGKYTEFAGSVEEVAREINAQTRF